MVVYNILDKEVAPAEWHKEACIMGIGAWLEHFQIPCHPSRFCYVVRSSVRPFAPLLDPSWQYSYDNIADEAGRGPVLGPMVYGVACCPLSMEGDLKKRAFADSKVLTAQQRDDLFKELEEDSRMCCFVDEISATTISQNMLAPDKVSLNVLALNSTIGLIQKALDSGIELQHIFVDTLGKPEAHKDRLSRAFPGIKFTVCPKADSIYPIVSAASIAAKVSRDRVVDAISLGENRGSGYPSDPATKAWLAANLDPLFGFDSSVRFSWGTVDRILDEGGIQVRWECDDDVKENRLRFKRPAKRFSYFSSRRLAKRASL
jgi:ribonuclease H2 subunit A